MDPDKVFDACVRKDVKTVEALLTAGKKYNLNLSGYRSKAVSTKISCLHQACLDNRQDIVKVLLSFGANIDIKDSLGTTPLMLAAWSGHIDLTKYLVARGANINIVSDKGFTALMDAAGHCDASTVQILLNSGAQLSKENTLGRTALDYAKLNQLHCRAVTEVLQQSLPNQSRLMQASSSNEKRKPEFLETFERYKKDVDELKGRVSALAVNSSWDQTTLACNDQVEVVRGEIQRLTDQGRQIGQVLEVQQERVVATVRDAEEKASLAAVAAIKEEEKIQQFRAKLESFQQRVRDMQRKESAMTRELKELETNNANKEKKKAAKQELKSANHVKQATLAAAKAVKHGARELAEMNAMLSKVSKTEKAIEAELCQRPVDKFGVHHRRQMMKSLGLAQHDNLLVAEQITLGMIAERPDVIEGSQERPGLLPFGDARLLTKVCQAFSHRKMTPAALQVVKRAAGQSVVSVSISDGGTAGQGWMVPETEMWGWSVEEVAAHMDKAVSMPGVVDAIRQIKLNGVALMTLDECDWDLLTIKVGLKVALVNEAKRLRAELQSKTGEKEDIRLLKEQLEVMKRLHEQERIAREQLEHDKKCQICFEGQKDTVLVPCGHVVCQGCAQLRQCPFCRETVLRFSRVFD